MAEGGRDDDRDREEKRRRDKEERRREIELLAADSHFAVRRMRMMEQEQLSLLEHRLGRIYIAAHRATEGWEDSLPFGSPEPYSMEDVIADNEQFREMVLGHFGGHLPPLPPERLPFPGPRRFARGDDDRQHEQQVATQVATAETRDETKPGESGKDADGEDPYAGVPEDDASVRRYRYSPPTREPLPTRERPSPRTQEFAAQIGLHPTQPLSPLQEGDRYSAYSPSRHSSDFVPQTISLAEAFEGGDVPRYAFQSERRPSATKWVESPNEPRYGPDRRIKATITNLSLPVPKDWDSEGIWHFFECQAGCILSDEYKQYCGPRNETIRHHAAVKYLRMKRKVSPEGTHKINTQTPAPPYRSRVVKNEEELARLYPPERFGECVITPVPKAPKPKKKRRSRKRKGDKSAEAAADEEVGGDPLAAQVVVIDSSPEHSDESHAALVFDPNEGESEGENDEPPE